MLNREPVVRTLLDGDLFAVPGLRGAALATKVKPSGALDLALVVADAPMTAAGVFTTNAMAAAPVRLCQRVLREHQVVRGIVVNAGNANALTGEQGDRDAEQMSATLDACCGGPSLVLSTGTIGVPLPVKHVCKGIEQAASMLHIRAGSEVSRAILTTDTTTKTVAAEVIDSEHNIRYTVGGMAKGSGMIHPNMATMLAVMATNAPIDAVTLRALLSRVVAKSFHEISVDGDTSTNDAVILLAQAPPSQQKPLSARQILALETAIGQVAETLALKVVQDGEGMTKLACITVESAKTEQEARAVAQSIARSPLVKTALAGSDPNWGRILSAAGNAGVELSPDHITLKLGSHEVFRRGYVVTCDAAALQQTFAEKNVRIRLDLGQGHACARMYTTDLTHGYISINSEYTT